MFGLLFVLIYGTPHATAGSLGDCYDAGIAECNLVFPREDSGDRNYSQCIKDRMAECDARQKQAIGSQRLTSEPASPPRGVKTR